MSSLLNKTKQKQKYWGFETTFCIRKIHKTEPPKQQTRLPASISITSNNIDIPIHIYQVKKELTNEITKLINKLNSYIAFIKKLIKSLFSLEDLYQIKFFSLNNLFQKTGFENLALTINKFYTEYKKYIGAGMIFCSPIAFQIITYIYQLIGIDNVLGYLVALSVGLFVFIIGLLNFLNIKL